MGIQSNYPNIITVPEDFDFIHWNDVLNEAAHILDETLYPEGDSELQQEAQEYFDKFLKDEGDDGAYDYHLSYVFTILDILEAYLKVATSYNLPPPEKSRL